MTQLFPEWIISNGSTDWFHQDAPSELEWQNSTLQIQTNIPAYDKQTIKPTQKQNQKPQTKQTKHKTKQRKSGFWTLIFPFKCIFT